MNSRLDIFSILSEADKRKKAKARLDREEVLLSLGIVEEFFEEGDIKIDMSICRGAECRLCIKVCPTNALYWDEGTIRIDKDLCIYCGACVVKCMVDDCVKLTRKSKEGMVDLLSTPRGAVLVINNESSQKRKKAANKRIC